MTVTKEQIEYLKSRWSGVQSVVEGNITYYLVPDVELPDGCTPARANVLICPVDHLGYPCRVFFSQRIECKTAKPNWNHSPHAIADKAWHAFSWQIGKGPYTLHQILAGFLKGLS